MRTLYTDYELRLTGGVARCFTSRKVRSQQALTPLVARVLNAIPSIKNSGPLLKIYTRRLFCVNLLVRSGSGAHGPYSQALSWYIWRGSVIEALVFEGGGVKGSAYAGVIEVLEANGVLAGVKRVAGASAGAITASLIATGGGSDGLHRSVTQTNFHDFITDHGGVFSEVTRFVKEFGLHNGEAFVDILKAQLAENCGNADITFQELADLSKEEGSAAKELYVVASNLSRLHAQVFSHYTSPDLEVWKAVRASIGIPFIFEPMHIDGNLFIDGGLTWNFPIDIFDAQSDHYPPGQAAGQTLGFFLTQHKAYTQNKKWGEDRLNIDSLKAFCLGIGSFMYEMSNSKHIHPEDNCRTVFIDDLGVNGADFSTQGDKIEALIDSGRRSTVAHFRDA